MRNCIDSFCPVSAHFVRSGLNNCTWYCPVMGKIHVSWQNELQIRFVFCTFSVSSAKWLHPTPASAYCRGSWSQKNWFPRPLSATNPLISQTYHLRLQYGFLTCCDVKNLVQAQSQASLNSSCTFNLINQIKLWSIATHYGGQQTNSIAIWMSVDQKGTATLIFDAQLIL